MLRIGLVMRISSLSSLCSAAPRIAQVGGGLTALSMLASIAITQRRCGKGRGELVEVHFYQAAVTALTSVVTVAGLLLPRRSALTLGYVVATVAATAGLVLAWEKMQRPNSTAVLAVSLAGIALFNVIGISTGAYIAGKTAYRTTGLVGSVLALGLAGGLTYAYGRFALFHE